MLELPAITLYQVVLLGCFSDFGEHNGGVKAFSLLAPLALCGLTSIASAATVKVKILASVDYCVISGALAPVPDGAPVVMEFNVDSTNFLNSASYPTRGYAVDLTSFSLSVGGVNVPIVNPQSPQCWFVLRDNDPAVDGFFISRGGVEVPFYWQVNIPGLTAVHELDFSRGFNNGSPFSSLDILGELGFYDFSNMASYQFTIGRFGNPGAEFVYESIELSQVVTSADLSGTLTLQDTGTFATTRTINYEVLQGATSLSSGSVIANGSSSAFSIAIPSSATGAATIVWDGSSFLRREVPVTLTGSNIALGTTNMQNGDVDDSGEVDAVDIDDVIADFGDMSSTSTDVNVSGEVDAVDIDIVIANFGGTND